MTIQRITFHPKYQAEGMTPLCTDALISVREPAEFVRLSDEWGDRVLILEFHDHDPSFVNELMPEYVWDDQVLFTRDDARAVLNFVASLPEDVDRLYVHCYAGISRSAAIAIALHSFVGLQLPNELCNYSLYNRHVYRIMMDEIFQNQFSEV